MLGVFDLYFLEKMRKRFIPRMAGLLFALVAAGGCAGSQWSASSKIFDRATRKVLSVKDIVIEIPLKRLPEREILIFNVKWMGITVGRITSSIKGIRNINGRDAYLLEAVFDSNAFLSAIFRIEDKYISYLDVEKLYSLRQEVSRRDGKFKKDAITDFDQENHKAHFKSLIDNSEKDFIIPENTQDILSAFYYLMLVPVKIGEEIKLSVYNNESNYQFFGIAEAKSFISTPGAGHKQAFLIRPYVELKGKKVEKGKLKTYFSCDKRRIPLLAVLQAPVFTEVSIVLFKIDNKEEAR